MQTRFFLATLSMLVFLFVAFNVAAQTVDMVGPAGSGAYGTNVTVLPNGNYIVTDPFYSEGGTSNIGAVYLYNGSTNALISVLKGSTANDQAGSGGIYPLNNSNFVISSPNWTNGVATNAGAVTLCSPTTGLSGIITVNNSLVGSNTGDNVGSLISILTNGNYVVGSRNWTNGTTKFAGAATWCNGTTGLTGTVNTTNSLVGSTLNDQVGNQIRSLTNGNYIVCSNFWNNGTKVSAGAATWCNGSTGRIGTVSSANSLIGSTAYDMVGYFFKVLTNGNYVIGSNWHNGNLAVGSATWGNGNTGISGTINASNSFVGTFDGDDFGSIIKLSNGNYIVSTKFNGKGSVTWGNGNTGLVGTVNSNNSLVGSVAGDHIGANMTFLSNGNYVVTSPNWNGNKGAVTFCKSDGSSVGVVSNTNSLVGNAIGDYVGFGGAFAIGNGNYVVCSPLWNNITGAATFCKSDGTTVGTITTNNSLIGSAANDSVGCDGVTVLANGNYVVSSYNWNNKTGAATWGNGTVGTVGVVSSTNSLVGSVAGDAVALGYYTPSFSLGNGIRSLTNGNYVVPSPAWNGRTGAATWGNGKTGTIGTINNNNSLIGPATNSLLANLFGVIYLSDGNYAVISQSINNGAGAVTWGNGNGGTVNVPNGCNTIYGLAANGGNSMYPVYDSTYKYLLVMRPADNIVSRYYPALGAAVPSSNDNSTTTISGNSPFIFPTTTGCGQIAALTPSGNNPVSGSVAAKTWLESPQPANFVARHYEITPAANSSTATGTITLYFTQTDFDGFNNQSPAPATKLPTGPTDAAGISHVLVQKEGGVSNVGTGLPGTYPGPVTTIDPADSNIVWNTTLQRWEVTFDVTGFSGFFVKTAAAPVVLPLQLLNFTGNKQGNNNVLQWTTANEKGTKTFVVESSANGTSFSAIGTVAATGGGNYIYTDNNPITSSTYYRLKMVDIDGKITYSTIIWINSVASTSINVYPNPVAQTTTVNINNNLQLIGTAAKLTDAGGRLIKTLLVMHAQEQIDMSTLPTGLYFLKLSDGTTVKLMKQ